MNAQIANENRAPFESFEAGLDQFCMRCGGSALQAKRIATVFPGSNGPVIVTNLPAMVCPSCGEEFIRRSTADDLKEMSAKAQPSVNLSVYDFAER